MQMEKHCTSLEPSTSDKARRIMCAESTNWLITGRQHKLAKVFKDCCCTKRVLSAIMRAKLCLSSHHNPRRQLKKREEALVVERDVSGHRAAAKYQEWARASLCRGNVSCSSCTKHNELREQAVCPFHLRRISRPQWGMASLKFLVREQHL